MNRSKRRDRRVAAINAVMDGINTMSENEIRAERELDEVDMEQVKCAAGFYATLAPGVP
ncbi:MAG: hypothetical protein ABSD38_29775 [Syntrophorhabdales bacterium]|jgi:hypothetical protein